MNQNLHRIFVPQIFNITPTIPPKQTNAVFIHAWPCLEFLHYSCTRAQSSVHVEFAISSWIGNTISSWCLRPWEPLPPDLCSIGPCSQVHIRSSTGQLFGFPCSNWKKCLTNSKEVTALPFPIFCVSVGTVKLIQHKNLIIVSKPFSAIKHQKHMPSLYLKPCNLYINYWSKEI